MLATVQIVLSMEAAALFQECHHMKPSFLHAFAYCFGVATAFVGALYVLVPARVRRLDRDNPIQIQWRSLATAAVCVGAILIYPFNFCSSTPSDSYVGKEPVLALIGLYRPAGLSSWRFWCGALAHSMVLYMGPITILFLQAKLIVQASSTPTSYVEALKAVMFPTPLRNGVPTKAQLEEEKWVAWRSQIIAPVLEEIAFRGCMVPPLMATGLFHPSAVAWIAPLFFGLAHCHHAALKLHQGDSWDKVVQLTAFQFLYTTLFGAYAAHAFLRSGSIVAVILSHSFCNTMGLPQFSFFDRRSTLHQYRLDLVKAYLLGLAIFVWGFFVPVFLPLP